jgi:hypothetical protein
LSFMINETMLEIVPGLFLAQEELNHEIHTRSITSTGWVSGGIRSGQGC